MSYHLDGKIALVTGGSKGLGKVISTRLAEAGAMVIVNYANYKEAAEQTAVSIQSSGGKAATVRGDITDEQAVAQLVTEVEATCGGTIDILVNNATGPQPELSIEESTWNDYLDQLVFFVKAPLLLTKAVLPGMKKKGEGRIITIGSEVVQLGNPNFSNYVTAKSSQIGMTRSWANELGPFGITVNLVNPGFIPVERHSEVNPLTLREYAKGVPLRKMGEPRDIGNAVAFLASSEARFITGQSISVNGGNTFGI
ncbi:SDR family oxidoreductase [Bacillus taeanensis]|uniref:3-oxoacyl-ACP reductase n=1 Tax=Bacillus taeanensis TaxID=273032 RepID=A0A366XRW6_9BACI|nr:SDR family oxidoreductase [Bacillus taeanensis]RBW68288.1 3-oxoacyl-ACP reductase [Bacillus taeanensis]